MSGATRGRDPELARLLLSELRRHELDLADDAAHAAQRRALHTLKGSAGIAGERALSASLARLERRFLAGDGTATGAARTLIADAIEAIAAGRPITAPVWPDPPDDLQAQPRNPTVAAEYASEMTDRLARIDAAMGTSGDDIGSALAAYREVHAMKAASLAVSDDITAWFCHGLEERLRNGQGTEDDARKSLAELTRWRGVLAEMIVAPNRALETLRLLARPSRIPSLPPSSSIPISSRRTETPSEPEPPRSSTADDATLRVPTATIDRLLERVRQLAQIRGDVSASAHLAGSLAVHTRELRISLAEALRLIGPPRPWGAPAAAIKRVDDAARALGALSDRLEREASQIKETADRVAAESTAAHGDLAAMRTTRAGWLFERVAAAVSAQARREGREVRLVFAGDETAMDRRLAELLVDPVLQLARNAVTHGIEPAPERVMRGKPRVGTVQLAAESQSGGLRIAVHDDGAGVDVADVRLRAIARGTISEDTAGAADDETLLSLLFVPGFTTRDSADLLAGRGVGLDLALEAVHRLGGTIRLATRPGMGLSATLDVPFEPGLVKVLWIEAAGASYALPVRHARRILLGRDPQAASAVPLAQCVQSSASSAATTFAVELPPLREDAPPPLIGVDRIGSIEEVTLRSVSPLVAAAGPYAGAIVRGAELRLCLDAHGLAKLASR
ncbi:Signal transduction histidine kinase CheA [Minicystis rosea]|nr:Signal transduction histidine kinase CheA [Minicystis rosea]